MGQQALGMVWSNFSADCPAGGDVALAGGRCLSRGIRLELHRHFPPYGHWLVFAVPSHWLSLSPQDLDLWDLYIPVKFDSNRLKVSNRLMEAAMHLQSIVQTLVSLISEGEERDNSRFPLHVLLPCPCTRTTWSSDHLSDGCNSGKQLLDEMHEIPPSSSSLWFDFFPSLFACMGTKRNLLAWRNVLQS